MQHARWYDATGLPITPMELIICPALFYCSQPLSKVVISLRMLLLEMIRLDSQRFFKSEITLMLFLQTLYMIHLRLLGIATVKFNQLSGITLSFVHTITMQFWKKSAFKSSVETCLIGRNSCRSTPLAVSIRSKKFNYGWPSLLSACHGIQQSSIWTSVLVSSWNDVRTFMLETAKLLRCHLEYQQNDCRRQHYCTFQHSCFSHTAVMVCFAGTEQNHNICMQTKAQHNTGKCECKRESIPEWCLQKCTLQLYLMKDPDPNDPGAETTFWNSRYVYKKFFTGWRQERGTLVPRSCRQPVKSFLLRQNQSSLCAW